VHESARAGLRQFVGFEVAGQRYLFRIERILEIVIPSAITRLPEVEGYVEGVMNLRGAIIPVVNLRRLFRLEAAAIDADTRLIVVDVGGRKMGCLVDSVSQIVRLDQGDLKPAPDTVTTGGPRYVEGFARSGDALLVVLDTEQLLAPANLPVVHRAGGPPDATEPQPQPNPTETR
jgi:purine-binding chemotaxis protein CheW